MNDDPSMIPDRAHVATERRNPRTMDLDTLSIRECVTRLNDEDAMVSGAVRDAADALTNFIEDLETRWLRGGRLIYLGAGTSGRLGVLDAAECPPTFQTDPNRILGIIAGGDAALRRSSEGLEDDAGGAAADLAPLALGEQDTLLGIAAGGTTPFVLGGIAFARSRGALTGLLTCSPPARPIDLDHLIIIDTGPEPITGSTRMKAGTATKLALNTITTTLMVRQGKVYENLMVDLRASNAKLKDRALRIVSEATGLDRAGAAEALRAADGSAKVAILMALGGLSRKDAEARLRNHDGRLRAALHQGARA